MPRTWLGVGTWPRNCAGPNGSHSWAAAGAAPISSAPANSAVKRPMRVISPPKSMSCDGARHHTADPVRRVLITLILAAFTLAGIAILIFGEPDERPMGAMSVLFFGVGGAAYIGLP